MMKRNIKILIVIFIVLVIIADITVIIYQYCAIRRLSSDLPAATMELRMENNLLKEGFFHTYDYEGASVNFDFPIYDVSANAINPHDLLEGENWLALFISAAPDSCRECLLSNIEFIKNVKEENIFVGIEGLSQKDFQIFVKEYGLENIAYRVYNYAFSAFQVNPAVFFIIDQDLQCKYFFAPSPAFPDLVNDYYGVIRKWL